MGIKIVTDSTSDIPKHLIEKYGIIELPLTVQFGDELYRDRIDITPEEFYSKLSKSKKLPTTSQVNPGTFYDAYKRELEKGNSIISIHISSELSGTYQSALTAKSMAGEGNINVVDSRNATLGLGGIVLKAAELAEKGCGLQEIAEYIEKYKMQVKLLIVVDTLEYLKKGGRLSGTQAVIGGLLNIKPILTIEDGRVVLIDKARGEKRALKRVIELMKEKGHDFDKQLIGVANANYPKAAEDLKAAVREEVGNVSFIESSVGSVIAAHVGPGAYGITFI